MNANSCQLIALYPISANPPTWGHAEIMLRASALFDCVYWAAAINPNKDYLFTPEERIAMMQEYVNHYRLQHVLVESYTGGTIRYAKSKGARCVIKGLRTVSDFQDELEQSVGNRGIDPSIETICMFAQPALSVISSGLVRELAMLGESIDNYVLDSVAKMVHHRILNSGIAT